MALRSRAAGSGRRPAPAPPGMTQRLRAPIAGGVPSPRTRRGPTSLPWPPPGTTSVDAGLTWTPRNLRRGPSLVCRCLGLDWRPPCCSRDGRGYLDGLSTESRTWRATGQGISVRAAATYVAIAYSAAARASSRVFARIVHSDPPNDARGDDRARCGLLAPRRGRPGSPRVESVKEPSRGSTVEAHMVTPSSVHTSPARLKVTRTSRPLTDASRSGTRSSQPTSRST
jgi:hypothetical protein